MDLNPTLDVASICSMPGPKPLTSKLSLQKPRVPEMIHENSKDRTMDSILRSWKGANPLFSTTDNTPAINTRDGAITC